jgi:mannose-6-phosphate isomerase-like protein (cupin superfamily)
VPLRKIDVAIASVFSGATSPPHYHQHTEEIYFILEGTGEIIIDGVTTPIAPGDCIRIPTFTVHAIRAGNDGLKLVVVTSPPYTDGDDHEVDTTTIDRPAIATRGIAVVAGTHRRNSVSGKVARQLCSYYRAIGVEVDLIDCPDPIRVPTRTYSFAA